MYWFQIIAQAESLGHFFLLVASTKVLLDAFCSNSVDIYFCRREGKMAEHAALRRLFPQILQNQPLTRLHLHPGGTCSCVGTPTAIPLKGVLKITTAVAPAHQDGWITVSQAFPLSQQWVHSAACNRGDGIKSDWEGVLYDLCTGTSSHQDTGESFGAILQRLTRERRLQHCLSPSEWSLSDYSQLSHQGCGCNAVFLQGPLCPSALFVGDFSLNDVLEEKLVQWVQGMKLP